MDPVSGDKCMSGHEMKVWEDASSMATVVALVVNGSIVEDVCWLRPGGDAKHINLAKLEALLWLSNGR